MAPDDTIARLRRERALAAQRAAQLERTFADIVDAAVDVATDDEHDPEGHTIAFERQQVSALFDEARRQVAELDAALARADAGDYGTCESCGRPIGDERLAALPETRRCIECAREV
jgi:RNA polymerase-binding transcription factor DksA